MKRQHGFTLIEVMITVAIVGILTAVGLPMYTEHVMRSRLTEAFSALSTIPPGAEQFWSNNRTFVGFDSLPPAGNNFTYALSGETASAYTVTATGKGAALGFTFTIDQNGTRTTTASPWGTSASCWVGRKDGSCIQ